MRWNRRCRSWKTGNIWNFPEPEHTRICFARLLKERSGYTVITNSIPVINEMVDSGNELIITGGTINPRVMSAMGAQTISFLKCIKVDVAILGSSGFDRHEGPSSNTFDDSQM